MEHLRPVEALMVEVGFLVDVVETTGHRMRSRQSCR